MAEAQVFDQCHHQRGDFFPRAGDHRCGPGGLRCKKAGRPLSAAAGGHKDRVDLYTAEGGWLHRSCEHLVEDVLKAKAAGFGGAKFKIGRPHVAEDPARVAAVRAAVGDARDIMVDVKQAFTVDETIRRASRLESLHCLAGGTTARDGRGRPPALV